MTVDKTDKTKQTTPDLDTHEGCWTSVSQRLSLKDELSMKAYSEDIDSLLTLDGLFSAVVTGFIALAVPMLQADSGQTSTQLLYTISTQLNSLVLTPPFINSTATVQPAQPFQATATARWINSLWFISLVFSLASAVMGILAKQWIREYLQWKSPSASARESVFLRELRSESWNIWHVSALISAVPILLEIAILLFTCGLAAYVRTLDLVVGVIVIVSVALFLLLVAALTILPSACRHCPYKSPTAWALLCLLRWFIGLHDRARSLFQWNASPDPSPSDEGPIISQYNMHFETIHSAAYLHSGTPPSWRTRDLEGAHINQLKHSTSNLGDQDLALHKELEFELRDAVEFIGVDLSNDLRVSSAALRVYRATVVEADLLFKVLVKLVMETPSHSTLQIVAQCTQAMLTSLSCTSTPEYTGISSDVHLAELALDGAFHNISVWCMLSRLDSAGPGYMGPLAQPVPPSRVIDQHTLVTSVLQAIRLFILGEQPLRTTLGCAFLPLDDKNNNRTAEYKESPFHYSQYIVMNYVLAYRLQDIVSQILHRSILDLGPSHSVPQLLHRRADEMLYTLRLVTFYWDSSSQLSRSCLWDCAQVLADVFNTISVSQYKARVDLVFPGLRTELFLVLSMSQYSISCTSQLILELGPPLEGAHTCDLAGFTDTKYSLRRQSLQIAHNRIWPWSQSSQTHISTICRKKRLPSYHTQ
ncbi:hypothetical protein PsYK624_062860 [Phanerochaete sordida]|uniref:DUF6535 domain-containing protein n=1 Tax=Phanerochaete sordida TaxID=48140 RepID=A0A9P3LCE3_9APHY|nr:hypothetical protein PsYK624_062860 [Phanerochaete sordida]